MSKKLASFLVFVLLCQSFLLSQVKDEFSEYLEETPHLDYNTQIFTEVLSQFVSKDMKLADKLEKLFYFTRDSIQFVADASLTSSEALKKNKAICYSKAMIFVSFCRRLGVPAKLALMNFTVHDTHKKHNHSHGIAKIFISGKWIYVDTVSNFESWKLWKFEKAKSFDPPEFSAEKNVLVSHDLYEDISFEDYETNDVPEEWLKSMEKFLKTKKW
jgi:hypothetical protein